MSYQLTVIEMYSTTTFCFEVEISNSILFYKTYV